MSVCRGLPDLRNPISSSIISLLFLPLELQWDSVIALGLQGDWGLCWDWLDCEIHICSCASVLGFWEERLCVLCLVDFV